MVELTTSARAPPPGAGRTWSESSLQAGGGGAGLGDRARVDISWSTDQPAPGFPRRTQRLPVRRGSGTCPAWEVKGNFAPAPADLSPRAPLDSRSRPLPLSFWSLPSLLLPHLSLLPSSSPAGGRQVRRGRAAEPTARDPGPVAAAAPSRRSDRARLCGRAGPRGAGRKLGAARSSEQGARWSRGRPHLEPALCAMELGARGHRRCRRCCCCWGPASCLVSFRGAGRIPFRPVQGSLGPPEPKEGRLWLQSQKASGCALQRGSRMGSPPRIPQAPKDCPSSAGGAGRKELTCSAIPKKGLGWVWGDAVRSWTQKLQLEWREVRPTPTFIHSAQFPCRLHHACPTPTLRAWGIRGLVSALGRAPPKPLPAHQAH